MDSIKSLSNYNEHFKILHTNAPKCGHIHKGHSTISHNATIPSKYETYVVENSDNRGFNSTSKRFNYEYNENVLPGVGYYQGNSEFNKCSPSFSKRGTGSFASKNRCVVFNSANEIPAPNSYNLTSFHERSDFNRSSYTRNFHPDIALKKFDKSSTLPAPNWYNIQSAIGTRNNISSFKSKESRDVSFTSHGMYKPGPGQYSINKADNLMNHNRIYVQSVFKSNSKRDNSKVPEGPGPSDYNVITDNKVKKYIDLRFFPKHYLCLAASALKLPPADPFPGPGKYNIASEIGRHSDHMPSSMFISASNRWIKPRANIGLGMADGFTGCAPKELPGPAHYQPIKPVKQSFHYNTTNRWM